jgi:magnesium-transporting ATPase (P-type)
MVEDDTEQIIERKAKRRAVISGALTSMIIVFLLLLTSFFNTTPKVPLTHAILGALCFSLFLSPLGGLAGSIGDKFREVILGAGISAIVFCSLCFVVAMMAEQTNTFPLLYFSLFCCALAVMGALCGGVGAVFGRTCREHEGKRFWPQFYIVELMILVFLVAILMSCLVTLRQILGKPA